MRFLNELAERNNQPVEQILVEWITSDKEIQDKLMAGGLVVAIGTDSRFTLAKELLQSCPSAKVTVIDRVPRDESQDKPTEVVFMVGEVGKDDLREVRGASLVIAKYLLHLVHNQKEVLQAMSKMLQDGGVMVVSVPTYWQNKAGNVIEQFKRQGWLVERDEVGQGLGKSVIWKLRR